MASVIEALKRKEGFTAVEEEIADYILHNADDISRMGIADLSAATHSSNATIVRLCKKLGLPGYRDLRIALAVELERRRGKLANVDVNKPFSSAESTATLMRSVAELQKEAIDTCYASLSPATIDELARAAIRAKTVYLYGIGDSGISGEMFSELVIKMGIQCVNASMTSDTLPRAYAAQKGSLAIFITYSGNILPRFSKDIEVLGQRGCQLAIITAHSDQDPLMSSFDIKVQIPPREAVRGKIATFYSQTCIRYVLLCVYGRIYDAYTIGLFGEPTMAEYRPNVERGIDTSGVIDLDYPGFRAVNVCAKDCDAPCGVLIEGTDGYIRSDTPPNVCGPVTLHLNDSTEETFDRSLPVMWEGEFREFERQLAEGDLDECYRQLDESLVVSRVQNEARVASGVLFPADE